MRVSAQTNPETETIRLGIENLFVDLQQAFQHQDAAAFDAHFTQDAVHVTAAGQRLVGWDEIHQYHSERLTHHADDLTVTFRVERVTTVAAGVAVAHTLQETAGPHGVRRNSGTWTLVYRDERWWIFAAQQTNVVDLPPDWNP